TPPATAARQRASKDIDDGAQNVPFVGGTPRVAISDSARERRARVDAVGRRPVERTVRDTDMSAFAPLLQAFFTDRLIVQRRASEHTITGYRDTFRLLLAFAATQTDKKPCALDIADLDAPLIGAFLDHLEHERGNQI